MLKNYDQTSISEFWANNEPGLEPDAIFDPYINLQAYCETHGKQACPEYPFIWFDALKRSAGELGFFTGLQICLSECKLAGLDIAQVKPEIEDFFSTANAKDAEQMTATAMSELKALLQYDNLSNASEIASYQILKGINNAINAFSFCVDDDFAFFEVHELKQLLKERFQEAPANGKKTTKR